MRVEEEDYTVGEYNIYRLPKFEEFDGVIFDLNNIIHEDVQREIVDRVKKQMYRQFLSEEKLKAATMSELTIMLLCRV